jgi:predicted O-linked N-acetylglucosamine transferase (SPINDLY family)
LAHSVASPEPADRLIAQGNELEDNGDFAAALSCYRAALALAPDYARAHMNVGNALQRLGRLDEAIAVQREATVRAPDYAPAHFNLASLLVVSGDLAAAESKLREALRLQPDMVEAAVVLADVLETTGRIGDAEAELKRVLRIRPDFAGAALNLGLLYLHNNRIDDAETILLQARAMGDSLAAIEAAFGTLYLRTGRIADARRALRHALDIDPALQGAQSPLLFALSLSAEFDAATIFREHARVGDIVVRSAEHRFTTWTNRPGPDRRIKIGYVSGDFRQHPVGLFLRPVLEGHDRARHEVHCYSNHRTVDSVTRLLQQTVEHWHNIAAETDAGVAERIRQDQIDILVDLSGHTDHGRLAVFAMHPAPIQVAWLGYLDTTGLATMDYRICDWHTDPEGATEHLHTERLCRLPHSQWCYAPLYDVPPAAPNQGERANAVVFGAFNQYMKLSDYCLDLWCRILAQLPEARLVALGVPVGNTQEAFRRRLAQRNIDPARVDVRDRLGILEYFAAIASVDIALDTFPYNGATTALDTLWMGVPLVAVPGERGVARGSYSILRAMRLPELIASGPDDYVNRNVSLARDRSRRNELRKTLRERLAKSPLMDRVTFVADLESAYRQMWRAWCDAHGSLRKLGS